MAKNYEVIEDSLTTLSEIMSTYQSEKGNVNFQLDQVRASALVKELFGEKVAVVRPRANDGKQRLVFKNLGRKSSSTSTEIQNMHGWIERGKTEIETKFVKFTDYKVNGYDHSFQLAMKSDGSFSINGSSGTSTTATQDALGFTPEDFPSSTDVSFLLFYTGSLHPCLGFLQTDHHSKVMRDRMHDSVVKEIDVNGETRLVSMKCNIVVRKRDDLCLACYQAKQLLSRRKAEFKVKQTKNSVLSKEELCQKLEEMKRKKRNAEKKEAYWKNKLKFLQECVEVDSDDHQDI